MSTAPVPIGKRCVYCKATGVPLVGDGYRKNCQDTRACAQRVAEANPEYQKHAATRAKLNLVSGGGTASVARNELSLTPAQALIAILQERAAADPLEGPFAVGDDVGMPITAAQARNVAFGKSGCGKSNQSAVTIENCWVAEVPVCGLDLLGNQWGLRYDGDRPGFGIPKALDVRFDRGSKARPRTGEAPRRRCSG